MEWICRPSKELHPSVNIKKIKIFSTLAWDLFVLKWLGQTNPFRFLMNVLNCFRFCFWICQDILLKYVHYSIPSICGDSVHIFSVSVQIHTVCSQHTNIFIRIFSYIYIYRFILRIRQMHLNGANIRDEIIFFTAFKGKLLQKWR